MASEYLLDITHSARGYLDTLDKKTFRQVAIKLMDLQKNPYPNDSILLKGQKSKIRRVDIGEHRIIYEVADNIVTIAAMNKRNDGTVYKKL